MYLFHLFKTNPLAAIAIIFTLATLAWCVRLLPLQKTRVDRVLMSLLGLIAMYEGLRVLRDTGFWALPQTLQGLDAAADATVAALYLIAMMIVQMSSTDRLNTKMQLRIIEAEQSKPSLMRFAPNPADGGPLGLMAVNQTGEICFWHASAETVFGWTKEEVLGTRLPFVGQQIADEREPRYYRRLRYQTKSGEDLLFPTWTLPLKGTGMGESGMLVMALKPEFAESRAETPAVAKGQAESGTAGVPVPAAVQIAG